MSFSLYLWYFIPPLSLALTDIIHQSIDLSHFSVHPSIKICTYVSNSLASTSNPVHVYIANSYDFSAILFPPTFAQIDPAGSLKKLSSAILTLILVGSFDFMTHTFPPRGIFGTKYAKAPLAITCVYVNRPYLPLRNRWPSRILAANSSHSVNLRCRQGMGRKSVIFGGCGCNTYIGL